MQLIVAAPRLGAPGGTESYTLTIGEHLARLGHAVTLYAHELGDVAELARERALPVVGRAEDLPERADGVFSALDASLAIELAARYPEAARVFVAHGAEEIYMPPPLEGVVHATVVMNDRLGERARARVGTGEVVRLRQPIDAARFFTLRDVAERPGVVLMLGNYHGNIGSRADLLKEAWSGAGLEFRHLGHPDPSLSVTEAMEPADIVVGYGRSILEGMSCRRPAYVFDLPGGDGWVTPDSYDAIEAAGFSGLAPGGTPDAAQVRADLDGYRAELGQLGRDLVYGQHHVGTHVAALIELVERLAPTPPPGEPDVLRAIAHLCDSHTRAELGRIQGYREAWTWQERHKALELMLHEEKVRAQEQAVAAAAQLAALKATRRYRIAQALAAPLAFARGRRR